MWISRGDWNKGGVCEWVSEWVFFLHFSADGLCAQTWQRVEHTDTDTVWMHNNVELFQAQPVLLASATCRNQMSDPHESIGDNRSWLQGIGALEM